jgi:hypothetical protein
VPPAIRPAADQRGSLDALCAEGRANPSANMTPDQACLANVWSNGANRGFTTGVDAMTKTVKDMFRR